MQGWRAVVLALALAGCGTLGDAMPTEPAPAMPAPAPAPTPAPRATVASRVDEVGAEARARLQPHFARAGVAYPPRALTLVALKDTARVEVWARTADGWRFVRGYPVMAASGARGPKLREGDLQVPEGVYTIDWLNPNSAYHLSMHVDYPNAFDREHAVGDGRTELGGAIMIHGRAVSVGCLAMGDPAIEELFTLVADTGLRDDDGAPRVHAILAPTDLRVHPGATPPPDAPAWTGDLYALIAQALQPLVRR